MVCVWGGGGGGGGVRLTNIACIGYYILKYFPIVLMIWPLKCAIFPIPIKYLKTINCARIVLGYGVKSLWITKLIGLLF